MPGAVRAGVVLALLAMVFAIAASAAPDPFDPPLPGLRAADAVAGATSGSAASDQIEGWQYTYQNLGQFWRIPPESSKLASNSLERLGDHTEYDYGTEEHLLTAWRDYLDELVDTPVWEDLSDVEKKELWYEYLGRYIGVGQNRAKGAAFERLLDEIFGYTALGYQHNRALPGAGGRRGDFFFVDDDGNLQVAIEAKSGKSVDRDQARMYAELAEQGARIIYVLGADPDPATVRFLEGLGFEVYYLRTIPQPGPATDIGEELSPDLRVPSTPAETWRSRTTRSPGRSRRRRPVRNGPGRWTESSTRSPGPKAQRMPPTPTWSRRNLSRGRRAGSTSRRWNCAMSRTTTTRTWALAPATRTR